MRFDIDYYAVLGVSPRASQAEIKREFRRLARETHPDLNPAPNAEARFKRINEAYEVLSDAAKRARYDRQRGVFTANAARRTQQSTAHAAANAAYHAPPRWDHTVHVHTHPPRSREPQRKASAIRSEVLQRYWDNAIIRILAMSLMLSLSLAMMGSTPFVVVSACTLIAMAVPFGLQLQHSEESLRHVAKAILNEYRVLVYAVAGAVGLFVVVPGLAYALTTFGGAQRAVRALGEYFLLLSVVLRLVFALVSVVLFSSLYTLREYRDRPDFK